MKSGLRPLEAVGFVLAVLAIGYAVGLYVRPAFDDEIHTLVSVEGLTAGEILIRGLLGGDIHPPLAPLLFKALYGLGAGAPAMRVASMALSALAFAAILDVALRQGTAAGMADRAFVVALFLFCPLLYGVGDSLRWYPLFAALVCVGLRSVMLAGHPTVAAGVLLGLAASTNFLAIVPLAVLGIDRYLVARRFEARRDAPFLVALVACGAAGAVAYVHVAGATLTQRDGDVATVAAMVGLGFFGGTRLGIGIGAAVLPYALAAALAMQRALRALVARRRDATASATATSDVVGVTLGLIVASALVVVVTGIAKPRSFLFMAPFVCALLALALPPRIMGTPALRWLAVGAALLPTVLVWLSIGGIDRPFKRNQAIPVPDIVRWIEANTPPHAPIYVSEPVLEYELEKRGRCVAGRLLGVRPCAVRSEGRTGPIVVVRDRLFDASLALRDIVAGATTTLTLATSETFGRDRDAEFKTRLSGVPLPEWLIRVELWR